MSKFFVPSWWRLLTSGFAVSVVLAAGIASALSAEKTVYAFRGGSDGSKLWAGLMAGASGNLYGTTGEGGGGACESNGCGTVFVLTPHGVENVLYAFQGGSDGSAPQGGVVLDGAGNIYGTTGLGGSNNDGTVFELSANGTKSVLYAFQGANDGNSPIGNLVMDGAGNLYGVTNLGGNSPICGTDGCGTVFKVTPSGEESVLHTFQAGSDGAEPLAGLVRDSNGNLYGTASDGGNAPSCENAGCGVVYEIAPDGTETILYTFQGYPTDGEAPEGTLILDSSGNIYGTTEAGGSAGYGTVFKLAPNGAETVLYSFKSGNDGGLPSAGVIMDHALNLYGTTWTGGNVSKGRSGTVFEVTAKGQEKILYAFDGHHGRHPQASLLLGAHGKLYGTTAEGGKGNNGVVFELKK